MPRREVNLVATEGIFRGLAKQNMLFHQCIGELVDNAIAASKEGQKFRIELFLVQNNIDEQMVDLYVADDGKGMDIETLEKALQLGESATTDSRLNEHGFGMKNALANLSGGNGHWKIWTRQTSTGPVLSSEGPFRPTMYVTDDDEFPLDAFLPADISTLIKVSVRRGYLQTVQGRGAPAKDLALLRQWLIEHLGVLYRGYLEQDEQTYENSGVIVVAIGNGTDSLRVPPVQVPIGNQKKEYLEVEVGGVVHRLEYRYGSLDTVRRDNLVRNEKARYYYQGNIPTQGVDIRLGKRVIANMQFENIWKTEDGESRLGRHNRYNEFVGELLIPELPRGILSTVNNKTDFNLDDPDWAKIFDRLNDYKPIAEIKDKSEKAVHKKWMDMLKATNPKEIITDQKHVWPPGAKIDVHRKTEAGQIIIYEIKIGTASPLDLYQLKMYWDGLALAGSEEVPKEAILLAEDFASNLEEMANMMNSLPHPGTNPYNFQLEKHADKGL